MRLHIAVLASLACLASYASTATAQVIYEPVRYQYQAPNGGGVFFYGGRDPFVFQQATALSVDPGFGRVRGLAFYSSTRTVRSSRTPVFSDAIPGIDLSGFGLTPASAANFANASVPTYFRKSDLLRAATVLPNGTRIVPAVAPVASAAPQPAPRPAPLARSADTAPKGVVIIIPYRKPDAPKPTSVAQ